MFLKKEKESQVKHESAFEQLRSVIAPVYFLIDMLHIATYKSTSRVS